LIIGLMVIYLLVVSKPQSVAGIAVRLSWVGWNKRSGSTKWEREMFKVLSAIEVCLGSPFSGELLLHKGFFLLFQAIRFLLQDFDFFVSGREHSGDVLFLVACWWNRWLVPPGFTLC